MAAPADDKPTNPRIAVYNALFDPVLCASSETAALSQVHVRRVSDAFDFAPANARAAVLRRDLMRDPAVWPVDVVLVPGKKGGIEGVAWWFGPDDESHCFISPIVGGGHDTHFWWRIDAPEISSGLRVGPIARFIQVLEGGSSSTIDLLSDDRAGLSVRVGDGLQLTIRGEAYSFFLLLRLVQHVDGEARLSFRLSGEHLEIRAEASPEPIWFIVTPHPHRAMKRVMGREAAALRLGISAIVSCEPISPRDHFILSMAPFDPRETPVSALPMAGAPKSVFCTVAIEGGGRIIWPTPSRAAAEQIADEIKSVIFVGCPSAKTLSKTFGAFGENVAWMAAPGEEAREVLYAASGVRLDPGSKGLQTLQVRDKAVAFVDYPQDRDFEPIFEQLAAFLDADRQSSLPVDITEPHHAHWQARLPALPHCMDLGVAMTIAVINRHRGRLTKDNGSMALAYQLVQQDALWFTPWGEVTDDRSALLVELIFRATAEYLASAFASDLKPWRVLETGGDWRLPSIDWDARPYLETFERSTSVDERQEATRNFLNKAKQDGVSAEGATAILADAFLKVFRGDRTAGSDAAAKGTARLNPLLLLVTEGQEVPYDQELEIAAGYWSAYAAAFAVSKPSALVPTLMHKGMLDDVRACQRELRALVRGASTSADAENVAEARLRLGDLVGSELERASFIVARTLGVDRVIAISAVMLDFVPYGATILGMETPLSRAPLAEAAGTPFTVAANVVASSCAERHFGRACILGAPEPRDRAEAWAKDIRESCIVWLQFSGIEPLEPPGDVESAIEAADRSGLVVFVGHAEDTADATGLDLGGVWLRKDDLSRIDWTGKVAILLGCETGALDGANLSDDLMMRGARAVIATTAKLDVRVADVFLEVFLRAAAEGLPIDYAFFHARRRAVIIEALMGCGMEVDEAAQVVYDKIGDKPDGREFSSYLAAVGLDWPQAYRAALYSLSLTLSGGAGERL